MKNNLILSGLLLFTLTIISSCNQDDSKNSSIESLSILSSNNQDNSKYSIIESLINTSEEYDMSRLKITVNEVNLLATFEDNSSTEALKEILKNNALTINMSDYGGFEKVGNLGVTLPSSDTYIKTTVGDIMLYQGNSIVIFYDSNSWDYTRIGKIEGITKDQMIEVFGKGNVEVTLSLI